MSDMITADLVDLDLSADTKQAAARSLAERMVALGRVTDLEGFLADVAAREAQMPTGLDGGIGIPHCRSEHVVEPTLAFGRSAAGIDFGAADGPADLIFLIAAPAGADDAHLKILSSLARQLMNGEFTSALRAVDDAAAAAALIRGDETAATAGTAKGSATGTKGAAATAEGALAQAAGAPEGTAATPGAASSGAAAGGRAPVPDASANPTGAAAPDSTAPDGSDAKEPESAPEPGVAPGAADAPNAAAAPDAPAAAVASGERPFRIVAVTSCPTGIAHTYMAAESLENAGRKAGVEVVVETQGSAGFTRLDPAVIAAADGVIFAHDVPVRDKDRFTGKPVVDVGVKAGINRPGELITEVRAKATREEATAAPAPGATPVERAGEAGEGYGTKLRKWLMSGVRCLRQNTWSKCRSEPSWTKSWSVGRPNRQRRRLRSRPKISGDWRIAWVSSWVTDPGARQGERSLPVKVRDRSLLREGGNVVAAFALTV